jgi:hydrogenase maturation factor
LPDAKVGDWVLVSMGQIVSIVSSEELLAFTELLDALNTFGTESDQART